jgi:putative membrane protein
MTGIPIVNALLFTVLGLLAFWAAVGIAARAAGSGLRKRIVEERNTAVAIVAAAVVLGIAWIVAATMH